MAQSIDRRLMLVNHHPPVRKQGNWFARTELRGLLCDMVDPTYGTSCVLGLEHGSPIYGILSSPIVAESPKRPATSQEQSSAKDLRFFHDRSPSLPRSETGQHGKPATIRTLRSSAALCEWEGEYTSQRGPCVPEGRGWGKCRERKQSIAFEVKERSVRPEPTHDAPFPRTFRCIASLKRRILR